MKSATGSMRSVEMAFNRFGCMRRIEYPVTMMMLRPSHCDRNGRTYCFNATLHDEKGSASPCVTGNFCT